jgi:hypothetical protein
LADREQDILRDADFQIVTRQHRLSEPTDTAERLYSVGVELLNHVGHPGPFRLVGLFAYDLVGVGGGQEAASARFWFDFIGDNFKNRP